MPNIVIYTKAQCPYCDWAKQFFLSKNLAFTEYRVDLDEHKLSEMHTRSQRRTVPQIFIDEKPIGGYDDLMALFRNGDLNNILKL